MIEDKHILELVVGGEKLRDMSAITFLNWASEKLNNVPTYAAPAVELRSLVTNPPMSRVMSDEQKIWIWRRLEALNVTLP